MKKAPRLSSRRLFLTGGLLLLFAGDGPFLGYAQSSTTGSPGEQISTAIGSVIAQDF